MYVNEDDGLLDIIGPIIELYFGRKIFRDSLRMDGPVWKIEFQLGNNLEMESDEE